jgi:hypothetical protein
VPDMDNATSTGFCSSARVCKDIGGGTLAILSGVSFKATSKD